MRTERGATLLDLVVGLAMSAVLAMAAASIFRALVRASGSAQMQLSKTRFGADALYRRGSYAGILTSAEEASGADTLTPGAPGFRFRGGPATVTFTTSQQRLMRTQLLTTTLQAEKILAVSTTYYSVGNDGIVFVSTAAESSDFVGVAIQVKDPKDPTGMRRVYGGAWLRNR